MCFIMLVMNDYYRFVQGQQCLEFYELRGQKSFII